MSRVQALTRMDKGDSQFAICGAGEKAGAETAFTTRDAAQGSGVPRDGWLHSESFRRHYLAC
jgi:hypothetical protein